MMNKIYMAAAGGVAVAAIAFYAGINAGGKSTDTMPMPAATAPVDAAFGEAVKNYLLANPEVVEQAQTKLAEQREMDQQAQQKQVLASMGDVLKDPDLPVIGDRNAPLTVVEFFDYNCGYCRRAMQDMEAILATNPDVKFVMKEFPILGEESIAAHRVSAALQALKPEAYQEFHRRLLGYDGRADRAAALTVATSLGLTEEQIDAQIAKPDSAKLFQTSYALAEQLNITGTPSYIIGDSLIYGAQGAETLLAEIERIRSAQTN